MHKHVPSKPLTSSECTSSQYSKWVKAVKEGMTFHSTKNIQHVHSKATYHLRCTSSQHSKCEKEVKGTSEFSLNTKSNLEYAQTCSFKDSFTS